MVSHAVFLIINTVSLSMNDLLLIIYLCNLHINVFCKCNHSTKLFLFHILTLIKGERKFMGCIFIRCCVSTCRSGFLHNLGFVLLYDWHIPSQFIFVNT